MSLCRICFACVLALCVCVCACVCLVFFFLKKNNKHFCFQRPMMTNLLMTKIGVNKDQ